MAKKYLGKLFIPAVILTLVISMTSLDISAVGQEIPAHLKLKAPREDILGSTILEWVVETDNGVENKGKIQKYAYITNRQVSNVPTDEVLRTAYENSLTVQSEILEKRTPVSRTFKVTDSDKLITEFTSNQKYYKDSNSSWWEIGYATTTPNAFTQQTASILDVFKFKNVFADTLTEYPDPGTGGPTGDMGRFKLDASFSTAREASTTPDNSSFQHNIRDQIQTGTYRMEFIGYTFDTSSIGSNQIDSATLSLWHNDNASPDGSWVIHLMRWNPGNNYNFTASDTGIDTLTDCSAGSTCTLDVASTTASNITGGQYNSYTLDQTGRSHINTSGVTALAILGDHFYSNSAPSNTDDITEIRSSDTSGISNDPKLVVIHTDTTPPAISNVQETSVTATSATITWNTDDYSDSKVSYGTSSGNYTSQNFDATMTTNHSISLSDLSEGMVYYYVVVSKNVDGGISTSTDQTFTTLTPLTLRVRKGVDESISSQITLQDDNDLILTPATSTTYIIDGVIFASSTSQLPDLVIAFSVPSDAELEIGYLAMEGVSLHSGEHLHGSQISFEIDLPATNAVTIKVIGTLKMGTTNSPLQFQWAQETSKTDTVTVLKGSYLQITEI